MRFWSSWWKTFPRREVAPTLLALAVLVAVGDGGAFVQALLGPCGFVWQ